MSNRKSLILWITAFAIIFIAVLTIVLTVSGTPAGTLSIDDINFEEEWAKGNTEAQIVLIEYSDFQCPACAYFAGLASDIAKEFDQHMVFVYRHFPLDYHDNAMLAAQAAEAAGLQDKFFEMHDFLFESQKEWSELNSREFETKIIEYAEAIVIPDLEKFKQDLNSNEVEKAVKADLKGGEKIPINSTPTFFLNGQQINPPSHHEAFRELIRETIKEIE